MHCDVYSLGQGEVSHVSNVHTFSLRNLQVLHGYRFESVPKEVLSMACGSLGTWKSTDAEMPKMEIVHHHQTPLAYMQLPLECRTPDFRKSGTLRKLVPITNPVERQMFVTGRQPYKVDPLPFGAPKEPVKRWEVPDLTKEAERQLEALSTPKTPVGMPDPNALPGPLPKIPPPSGPLKDDPHARPDMSKYLPPDGPMVHLDPGALDYGPPGPGDTVAGGLLDEDDVSEPEHAERTIRDGPRLCTSRTARGDACRRRVTPGTEFCGAHQRDE